MKTKLLCICLGLSLAFACNRRGEKEEGEAYNPYDTSDQITGIDSISETMYTLDSLENSLKQEDPGSKKN